ncbi:MAG: hypothetical protein WC548_01135 [Candidatus Pacearchaeota archaeon]
MEAKKDKTPLMPRKVVKVNGKVHYSESNQAWNTIKLKSEFLNEFQQLKEKRSQFSYEMIFGRNEEEMVEALRQIIRGGRLMPILMFLYKEKESN